MALDLDKISPELERALEQARQHAESAGTAVITPWHMLLALADRESSLAGLLARAGGSIEQFERTVQREIAKQDPGPKLTPGRRPTAGRSLRELIEKSFEKMAARGAEMAEGADFVAAAAESGDDAVRKALEFAGVSAQAVEQAAEKKASTGEALGEPKTAAAKTGSALSKYGRDLTALAAAGELMPVLGRDEEIRQVIQTLLRKTKSNPVLVGDPGTGKTAVAEGLALRIAAGDVPESLRKCKVIALDLTSMVAGAKYRGEFEERIKGVVDETRSRKGEVILFLDELHTLVGAGGSEGGMDAANILKPALARGELRCVGATTYDEYREKIEKDGALARRFEVVAVKEPTDEVMITILRGIRTRYETFHGVRLSDDSLHAAIKLSRRYLRTRFLPDKAIDIIDEATARLRMQKESKPTAIDQAERGLLQKRAELAALEAVPNAPAKSLEKLREEIARIEPEVTALLESWRARKDAADNLLKTKRAIEEQNTALAAAEAAGNVAKAAEIRYGALHFLGRQLEDQEKQLAAVSGADSLVADEVLPEHVAEVVAERAGVPIHRMLEGERERLLNLEERIESRVYGQTDAVAVIADAVRRIRTDLQPERKPNSFLFVGPTGVGKTELAKALADAMFDDDSALIRIDMGEYKDQSSVASLIGSRPGLIGSDQGGFLTERVRRSPYSIVLFDEVEKAHPEVLDLLLGVLDEGRLSDAKGRFCDFSNTVILFTSNLGVREAMAVTDDLAKRQEIIMEVVKASLRPEFFNRITQVIPFNALTVTELERIVGTHLGKLKRKLGDERDLGLEVTPEAMRYLVDESNDPAYGARPVGRTIQKLVLSPLASVILSGDVSAGQKIVIGHEEGSGLSIGVEEKDAGNG